MKPLNKSPRYPKTSESVPNEPPLIHTPKCTVVERSLVLPTRCGKLNRQLPGVLESYPVSTPPITATTV